MTEKSKKNNNILAEAIKQKIKLFTKESYYKYFTYFLVEKSKNTVHFRKNSIPSLSIEFLLNKKEKVKLKIKEIEIKNTPKSLWHLLMSLICNVPNKKKTLFKNNKFNLNPICFLYLKNLCQIKIKLLQSFSNKYKVPLDVLVKFYLDLCTSQISKKENVHDKKNNDNIDIVSIVSIKNEKTSKIIEYKRLLKKNSLLNKSKRHVIKKNNNISNNNIIENNKEPMLGLPQVEYKNSFSRLFIGEEDPRSVKERYFSNIVVKKLKQLHLYSSYSELANLYLNNLYNKIFNKEYKGYIDNDLVEIMNKFKYDSNKVKSYKRNDLSFEKKRKNDEDNDYDYDEEKENISQIKKCKSIFLEQNNKKGKIRNRNKKYKNLSLSPVILKNDNKKNFRYEKNFNYNNIRYNINNNSSSIFNNDKSQNLSSNLSYNISSYNIKSPSVKHSPIITIKEMRKKMSTSNYSTINLNNNNCGSNYNNNIIINKKLDNFFKELEINNRNKDFIIKLRKRFNKNNSIISRKKRINLKNYLNKEDFFFSKMN